MNLQLQDFELEQVKEMKKKLFKDHIDGEEKTSNP